MTKQAWMHIELPIDIEEKDGLFFITSPLIKGLLVAELTEALAIERATGAVHSLAGAAQKDWRKGRTDSGDMM